MAEVGNQIANLVAAIASGGSGFQSIRSALLLAERNKEHLATERDALRRQIEQEAGEPIDSVRVRENLQDFQLLYEAATDDERGELLRLLVKDIVVEPSEENGPGVEIAIHFWSTVTRRRKSRARRRARQAVRDVRAVGFRLHRAAHPSVRRVFARGGRTGIERRLGNREATTFWSIGRRARLVRTRALTPEDASSALSRPARQQPPRHSSERRTPLPARRGRPSGAFEAWTTSIRYGPLLNPRGAIGGGRARTAQCRPPRPSRCTPRGWDADSPTATA